MPWLHTMAEWNGVMADVNKLNRFVKKNNDFIRMFTAGSEWLTLIVLLIQIPKDLINFAGIKAIGFGCGWKCS